MKRKTKNELVELKKTNYWVKENPNDGLGPKDGIWLHYYNTGELWSRGNLLNGTMDGDWVWYYDTGELWSTHTYKNGKMEGVRLEYHSDGWVNRKSYYHKGEVVGVSETYNKDGNVVGRVTHYNGNMEVGGMVVLKNVEVKNLHMDEIFYANGKLKSKEVYYNNNCIYRWFDFEGKKKLF